ncbi:hypothetical protein Fmac_004253 [Flemingia macrophylla]|uniref:Phosphoribosyltransferase domain-containing protein n=1 Tax=Flemingia macrophylla TaxID=520843 RepID=A0ABD1N4L4_9FABA
MYAMHHMLTCALDLIEATYEREVIVVDKNGLQSLCLMTHPQPKQCIFEHIYFTLPNSVVFGRSIYDSCCQFGEILVIESPIDCEVVIVVPDSGAVAALGYAAKVGVPFQQGLIRSHYIGRTFIEPFQKIRDFGVKLKLSPVRAVLEGKHVVVVDDSVVRGTTSSKIVKLLKEVGAKEVHMRIVSPPITRSYYYGVDTHCYEELISNSMSPSGTRNFQNEDGKTRHQTSGGLFWFWRISCNRIVWSWNMAYHHIAAGTLGILAGLFHLSVRPARRAISSVVERAPDNCVVVPGL